jgi:hypothetical protein
MRQARFQPNHFSAELVINAQKLKNLDSYQNTSNGTTSYDIVPQSCRFPKNVACAAAVASCAAICYGTLGAACVTCFANLGMSSCMDCL